uniref:Uncharacterized protein n=1 Tax=Anguilla anguilla TaxID=7936 RepID=A0A0E9WME4_ANGAN
MSNVNATAVICFSLSLGRHFCSLKTNGQSSSGPYLYCQIRSQRSLDPGLI